MLIFLLAASPAVAVTGNGLLDICAKGKGIEQACIAYIGGHFGGF